jgi:hypothetical protein
MPNIENLKKVREKVFTHKYPKKHQAFAGAGLIITDDPKKMGGSEVIVYHRDAQSLSWLVFQLKEIFSDSLDYMVKYHFYETIGGIYNECLRHEMSVHETMIYMVGWAEKWISDDEYPTLQDDIEEGP